mgnify:CR=1 FL=1
MTYKPRTLLLAALFALAGVLGAAPTLAGDEEHAMPDLPDAVSELVEAMSGVEHVEAIENDQFKIHRRIQVTGSRVARKVAMVVAEDGTVLDWGRDPSFLRSYTLSELRDTGNADLAKALADLDPSIQTRGGG